MSTILLTNDDGVESEGLHALAAALRPLGRVVVCAPVGEASAIGHALTLARPLRLKDVGVDVHAVDGTPADCVNIAVSELLGGQLPDLVIAGINKGWNVGDDVTYSGTVGGALEGVLMGVPAVAVSLQRSLAYDFGPAAAAGAAVAGEVLAHGLPTRVLLNVNVPHGHADGLGEHDSGRAYTHHQRGAARRPVGAAVFLARRRAGRSGRSGATPTMMPSSAGLVSVTPLHADLTAHAALPRTAALVGAADRAGSGLVVDELALVRHAGALDESHHGLGLALRSPAMPC